MAWWVAPLIMGTAKIGSTLLQRPRERRPDTSWIDEMKSEMRTRRADRGVSRTILRESQKVITDQTRRARELSEYQSARHGTRGTGIAAARDLQITRSATQAAAGAGVQAGLAEAEAAERDRTRLDELNMLKERLIQEARERHKVVKSDWKRQMGSSILEAGAGMAAAGIQHQRQWNDAIALAESHGMSAEDLKATGASTPETALQAAGIMQKQRQQEDFFHEMQQGIPGLEATQVFQPEYTYEQNMKLLQQHLETLAPEEKSKAGVFVQLYADPNRFTEEDLAKLANEGYLTDAQTKTLFDRKEQMKMGDTTRVTTYDSEGRRYEYEAPVLYTEEGHPIRSIAEKLPDELTAEDKDKIERNWSLFTVSLERMRNRMADEGHDKLDEFMNKAKRKEFSNQTELAQELSDIVDNIEVPLSEKIFTLGDIVIDFRTEDTPESDELKTKYARDKIFDTMMRRLSAIPAWFYMTGVRGERRSELQMGAEGL